MRVNITLFQWLTFPLPLIPSRQGRGNLTFYEFVNFDGIVKSRKIPVFVIPAQAGIQENQILLDSRLRGGDGFQDFLQDHQAYWGKNGNPPALYSWFLRSKWKETKWSIYSNLLGNHISCHLSPLFTGVKSFELQPVILIDRTGCTQQETLSQNAWKCAILRS